MAPGGYTLDASFSDEEHIPEVWQKSGFWAQFLHGAQKAGAMDFAEEISPPSISPHRFLIAF